MTTDEFIIQQVLANIEVAKSLRPEDLVRRNNEPTYPVTTSELIVSHTLHLLLTHEWQRDENEWDMSDILNSLQLLDTGVDKPQVWQELFDAYDKYRKSIGQ